MHEYALAQAVLKEALRVAAEHGGRRIESVRLVVGSNRQVIPETLAHALNVLARETPADGARFDWREVPVRIRCRSCGGVYAAEGVFRICPVCEAPGGDVIEGRELMLEGLTLSDKGIAWKSESSKT